jgi:NAD(P)-dependent dehydrogenase (short-subunit alcohol dehydrogenase family)
MESARPPRRRSRRRGANVVIADLDGDAAESVASAIEASGGTAAAKAFNLGELESVERMIAWTVDTYGGIDVPFYNAAATCLANTRDMPISMADPDVWDETFLINVRGAMSCIKSAAPSMVARGGGSIVNVASGAGMTGDVGNPAYAASKAAIIRMTTYAAVEFGRHGLRCNAIAPGLIVTRRPRTPGPPARCATSWSLIIYRVGSEPRRMWQMRRCSWRVTSRRSSRVRCSASTAVCWRTRRTWPISSTSCVRARHSPTSLSRITFTA